jgi:rhodanese-related sulfurtransferase
MMKTITKDELRLRLNKHEPVQLVMALGDWAYNQLRIPGSLNFRDWNDAAANLLPDQEIVIYCTNADCPASYRAYYQLLSMGYKNIARFSGGIQEWMEAGLPVEGSLAGA